MLGPIRYSTKQVGANPLIDLIVDLLNSFFRRFSGHSLR